MKKTLSVVLSLLLVLQTVFAVLPAMAASTVLVSYEDTFNYDTFDSIYEEVAGSGSSSDTGITSLPASWVKEGDIAPDVENGVLKFAKGDKNEGVRLKWTELTGFSFDKSKTYTLTFDVKATDFGSGSSTTSRELYFGLGGYYNLFEFLHSGIRAGDTWNKTAGAYALNTTYNCILEWKPAEQKITCTVMNGSTVVATGYRTHADFGTLNNYSKTFGWRCEDGASEVSNVTFTDGSTIYNQFETGLTPLPTGWVKEASVTAAPNAPKVKDGILKFVAGDGLRLNWTTLPGFSFDASKTYTITFDTKITNFGTNPTSDYRREVYFAPDGWFNMLELKHDALRAGGTYNYDVATDYKLNTLYSCTVIWEPADSKMTCTLKEGDKTVVSGSRIITEFGTLNDRTKNFVWRCEDGAMEVSNVTFSDSATTYTQFTGTSGDGPAIPISEFVWEKEYSANQTDDFGGYNGNQPKIEDGVAKLNTRDSLRFNWPSAGFTFDESKTYTMKFDVKVNSFGETMSTNMNREFYFAPGGYWNMIEFRGTQQSGKNLSLGIRTGGSGNGTWAADTNAYKAGNTYTCEVVWIPAQQKMTATVSKDGTQIVTGYRTMPEFATLNRYTRSFALRCENGSIEIDNFSFTDDTDTFTYTQNFYEHAMAESGVWSAENKVFSTAALKPQTFGGNALTLDDNMGVLFNWKNVSGAAPFVNTRTYTFEFDAQLVGGEGDSNSCSGRSRALYVGFGGWYNLLEVHTEDDGDASGVVISSSGAKAAWGDSYKNIHVKIDWEGATATTTITDKNGNVLLTGKRTSTSFADTADKYMDSLGIRCEDGQAKISNFKFTVSDKAVVSTKEVNIPSGKQAYYECNILCGNNDATRITLGNADIFAFNNGTLTLGAKIVTGTYVPGAYNVKLWINPVQKMVTAEVIAPDGDVARRGTYTLADTFKNGDSIKVFSDATDPILNEKLTYLDVNTNDYKLVTTEPQPSGYIYNVVTSFNKDAATDRAFAWTAGADEIGSSNMVLQYRVKGASAWQQVTASRVKNDAVSYEEYFKADIENLTPETTYEYKIGKEGSSASGDWSTVYTFKTAAASIEEFSFVAIGDTQSNTWSGARGYNLAKASLDEAFQENSDLAMILHTGDVVDTGTDINQWNWYFKSLAGYGESIPHFATMGNHETYQHGSYTASDGTDNFNNHFNHPNNGGNAAFDQSKLGGLTNTVLKHIATGHADEMVYSFDYGDAHFIVINSGAYTTKSQDLIFEEAQEKWLINDIEANKDAPWTIMMFHMPAYHRNGGGEDRGALASVIEKYDVDLVLLGHSHLVTRTYPMRDENVVTKEYTDTIPKGTGTIYLTVGSTTNNHDGTGDPDNVEPMYNIVTPTNQMPTYTIVTVNGEEIVVTVKQVDGLVVEKFTIKGDCQHVAGDWVTTIEPTTLASGKQELRCIKCNALLDTKELPKLVDIPQTGDDTNLYFLTACLVISCLGIYTLTAYGKKRKA